MMAPGQFLVEEAQPLTTATPSPSFAMARAFTCFRRQTQPAVQKSEPGRVFRREGTAAGGGTEWTDLEQTDYSSPFGNPRMTD